ncbi:unnamed protein product [Schistocephalus solidus]|uniref:Uncharacterized protein n=1 Tax=Schistocephalus solidus TaxID=70667 RepID=A0A183TME0_SCHSO|nr:unnamed protein product [Schistocephalus solidus]
MAKRLMKMPGIAKPQPAALSTSPVPSVSPLSHLKTELAQVAKHVASLQAPTASSSRSPTISTVRSVQSSSSRPTSATTCSYHPTFSVKARRCISPCSFVSPQNKRVSLKVNVANITGVFSPGRTFCSSSDKRNPQELRQLAYISQFTSDIRHIDGACNEVSDALSRPSIAHLELSPGIDLTEMAAEQRRVGSPCDEKVCGLQL